MADILQGVGIPVDLHHAVLVDAVDRPVGPPPDLLAALHGDGAEGLLHRHHLGKAGHVQDLVDLGAHVHDPQRRAGLFQAQEHPEPGAGDIVQARRIQGQRLAHPAVQLHKHLFFHLGGVVGIDPSAQPDPPCLGFHSYLPRLASWVSRPSGKAGHRPVLAEEQHHTDERAKPDCRACSSVCRMPSMYRNPPHPAHA